MQGVKSKDTKPEKAVRELLWRMGYRYRLHVRDLPGRPDIVFTAKRVAVFVHGCFWHRHSCQKGRMPLNNAGYWAEKLSRNVQRDSIALADLEANGWKTVVIWECEVNDQSRLKVRLRGALGGTRTR